MIFSLLLLQNLPVLTNSQSSDFPPLVVRKSVAWLDDSGLWIFDISLYSSMPWYIGDLGYVALVATLNTAPPGKDLHIIVRIVTSDGNELVSKSAGSISSTRPVIRDEIRFVVSSFYFSTNGSVTDRNDLKVLVEGYIDGRRYEALIDLPVFVSTKTARLSINVFVNDVPDYNFLFESITRVNISALIRNTVAESVNSVVITFYINESVVDRVTIDRLGGLESRKVATTVFKHYTPGIYYVKVKAVYYLPGGVQEEASALGILEVGGRLSITLNVDKSVVMEGTQVVFTGTLTPPTVGQVILERLIGNVWVISSVVTSNASGMFAIPWVAENVLPGYEYMTHTFRVKVLISSIGGNATVYSPTVRVNVFPSERVVDLVGDISLDVVPDTTFKGSKVSLLIRLRPALPLCVPAKIVYREPTLYEWVEVGEVVVCDGEGSESFEVRLDPGKYLVKAVVVSKFRRVESLPKALTVVGTPTLNLDVKSSVIYGEPLEVKVRLHPQPEGIVQGNLYITYREALIVNSTLPIVNGEASTLVKDLPGEGVLNITACASVYGAMICNTSEVNVIKPSMIITPTSTTAEVNALVSYSITITPKQRYAVKLSVLQDSSVVSSYSAETDDLGIAKLDVKAPLKAGKYTVLAEIPGKGISATGTLNVIEIVRTVRLELLNKSVEPLSKVTAKVTLYPPPTAPTPVVLLIQVGGSWTTVSSDLITAGDSKAVSFTAPEREGTYQVKVQVPTLQVESNTEMLSVSSPVLLRQEYLYMILGASAVTGVFLFLLGRRRRR